MKATLGCVIEQKGNCKVVEKVLYYKYNYIIKAKENRAYEFREKSTVFKKNAS